jgi:hypothetical protein
MRERAIKTAVPETALLPSVVQRLGSEKREDLGLSLKFQDPRLLSLKKEARRRRRRRR